MSKVIRPDLCLCPIQMGSSLRYSIKYKALTVFIHIRWRRNSGSDKEVDQIYPDVLLKYSENAIETRNVYGLLYRL